MSTLQKITIPKKIIKTITESRIRAYKKQKE